MYKTLCKGALLCLLLVAVGKWCRKQTDGFTLAHVRAELSFHPEWDAPSPPLDAVRASLAQRFSYLAKGAQCYVFVSEDGATVLKLFKQHKARLSPWDYLLPYALRARRAAVKRRLLERDLHSCALAFRALREECGLLYLHLNPTQSLHCSLALVDNLHITHLLPADETAFVLQKKADLVYPKIRHFLDNRDLEGAKRAVRSLRALLVRRAELGVFDQDPNFSKNFGFVGERAIQIDIGRLSTEGGPSVREEQMKHSFKEWLGWQHPELAKEMEE
jgi:hypothetical protein